ncbi:MAG: hypothetical protein ABJH63_16790 [Rhizobiaceae bacterium]
MTIEQIFLTQFSLSLFVVSLLFLWVVKPWLSNQTLQTALFWLMVPHALRHLGLVFVVPGVVEHSMPQTFAGAAAYGDLAAGVLAIIALIAIKRNWLLMLPIAWLVNIVGIVDLANALRQAEAIPHMGAAWYIPTFVVPVLLVTHFTMVVLLAQQRLPTARVDRTTVNS